MVTIIVERTIPAPPEDVFAWLVDSSNYTDAALCLREKRTRDGEGAPYGVGAIREIVGIGAWFREEITAYDAPHTFSYLIIKSVPPMKHDGGTLTITPTAGGSHVHWKTSYTHPGGATGRALEKVTEPVLRTAFNGTLKACEKGLAGTRA